MKRVFAIIITALLLAGFSATFTSSSASALSTADQKGCVKAYDGKKLTAKQAKDWKSNPCAKVSGGNCTKAPSNKVSCAAPTSADPAGTSGGAACATGGSSKDPDYIADPAASSNSCGKASCDPSSCDIITNYINPFITLLTVLVGIAVAIGIIFGGIQVTTSAGDPSKQAAGKKHIQNALIALVAYVLLYGFLNWLIPGGII